MRTVIRARLLRRAGLTHRLESIRCFGGTTVHRKLRSGIVGLPNGVPHCDLVWYMLLLHTRCTYCLRCWPRGHDRYSAQSLSAETSAARAQGSIAVHGSASAQFLSTFHSIQHSFHAKLRLHGLSPQTVLAHCAICLPDRTAVPIAVTVPYRRI